MEGRLLGDGRYRLVRPLGKGGTAAVWEGVDLRIERLVAIKLLHPTTSVPDAEERLRREAKAAGNLASQYIVRVYDLGRGPVEDSEPLPGEGPAEAGEQVYIVMEYLRGRTLAQILAEEGRLPVERVVLWGRQIAMALSTAHAAHVLHRDIKPSNVLVTDQGVKVLDFGIARFLETVRVPTLGGEATAGVATMADLTRGMLLGTPAYMSPEQVQDPGNLDVHSDLYSLGCVLYELLTGAPPFGHGEPFALWTRHAKETPRPLREQRPEVPEELEELVLQLLRKRPEERPRSAEEVVRRLLPPPAPPRPDDVLARLRRQYAEADRLGATDPREAVRRLSEEVLPQARSLLGEDHIIALQATWRLAHWTGATGDARGAYTQYSQLVPRWAHAYGRVHPTTLELRSLQARWAGRAGEAALAAELTAALVRDSVEALGGTHRDTLWRRYRLAHWTGKAGSPAEAVRQFRELLPVARGELGEEHRLVSRIRYRLAWWTGDGGDPHGAVRLFRELVGDYLRLFGTEHPETLAARSGLAWWTSEAGDPAAAARLYEDLVRDSVATLGPEHAETLVARYNHAESVGAAGDPAGAARLLRELVADTTRVLGPDHPDTVAAHRALEAWEGWRPESDG
ncbi:serine/threonine-protein kinase [Allostreptomyces psammosilenae]|uniref:non-specific serine/threonine protein kinase n=1 Tax=Allostreptomyces psammosilenae TaxID=1892865 RepID=A0A853A195_9ACTN|nr:serine/threonine-protein kinase [Allostreptomyces psammosilenae]NYI08393.1 serine/threonine protein kinase [Allostreptomyces psammosilenae]